MIELIEQVGIGQSIALFILGLLVLKVIWSSFVNVGGTQIAGLERRWLGKKMPPERVIALKGEIGVQARILGPGLHFLWPFIYKVRKDNFITIGDNQVGYVEALAGDPMPLGSVFAKVVAGHNMFQDGEAFLEAGGQKGPQVQILPPGPYRINPRLFKITAGEALNVPDGCVALIETSDGLPVPPGRVYGKVVEGHDLFQNGEAFIHSGGQKGPQIEIITNGKWRINQKYFQAKLAKVVDIAEDEIGLVESVDGDPVEAGHIFAKVVEGHNMFQDGGKFLENGGEKGPQIEVIPPGRYRINTNLFHVTVDKAVMIQRGEIGIVTSRDGAPIPNGRLLGCHVEGHNRFQDGEAFLDAKGQRGPQVEILLPGTYRINTAMFAVEVTKAVVIPAKKVGLVTAKDGEMLPPREYVAKPVTGHNDYQDGEAFLKANGQRGPQFDVLKPGTYYINPLMFDVSLDDVAEVERGQVAVIVSNVGEIPPEVVAVAKQVADAEAAGNPEEKKALETRLEHGIETYVVPKGFRGIQREVAGPGTYYLNRIAYKAYVVDTTNQTIDWADDSGTADQNPVSPQKKSILAATPPSTPTASPMPLAGAFNPLTVVSKDGFSISVAVKVVIRVRPDQAPYMVAKIGSIENLINHVIHPMIDSSFRNQASCASAMAFMQNRHEEQEKAEARTRLELEKYHVDLVSVLICQIILPKELMDTQTERILADQRQAMYQAQQKAEQERIASAKTKAEADKQAELVQSEIDVKVATQNKLKKIQEAEGEGEAERIRADKKGQAMEAEARGKGNALKLEATGRGEATRLEGEGEASKIRSIGQATGDAHKAEGVGIAEGYKAQKDAIGGDGIVNIEITKSLSAALATGGVKIVPDVLMGGSDGSNLGSLISGLLLQKMMPGNKTLIPESSTKNH
ncbi:MAG: SPFH domain-containing protein [Bacteroidota bacterium]